MEQQLKIVRTVVPGTLGFVQIITIIALVVFAILPRYGINVYPKCCSKNYKNSFHFHDQSAANANIDGIKK